MPFSGFQDFEPAFGRNLQAMIKERPGIGINSGYRTVERQRMLWNRALQKYGSVKAARKWVAPPGHSMHNKRMAADLGFQSKADEAWAHANAARFGLRFRMGHERWHIEPANGGRGVQMVKDSASGSDKPLNVTADGTRALVNKDATTQVASNSTAPKATAPIGSPASLKPVFGGAGQAAAGFSLAKQQVDKEERSGLGSLSQSLADAAAAMGNNEAAWSWVTQAMAPRPAAPQPPMWLGRPIWL